MNLDIRSLPYGVDQLTVIRSISAIVHSKEFATQCLERGREDVENASERLTNFAVKLNPSRAGGVGNNGSGLLTFDRPEVGSKFLEWVKDHPFEIEGRKVKFSPTHRPPLGQALQLQKTSYVDPEREEKRQKILAYLQEHGRFLVEAVQFGLLYRPNYQHSSRAFSVEWERKCTKDTVGCLTFDYDQRVIRITLGDDISDNTRSSIAINLANIQKIYVGDDFGPYLCFDLLIPPTLEEHEIHRSLTGDRKLDSSRYKRRLGYLHPGHQIVAPYAQHLRIPLYDDPNQNILAEFAETCKRVGLPQNIVVCLDGQKNIETSRQEFFTPKRLYNLEREFKGLPWQVAFQLEALLHNHLLHTSEVTLLLPLIRRLSQNGHNSERYTAELLRHYHEKLEAPGRPPHEPPSDCFERVHRDFIFLDSALPPGNFFCSHVTFTPTRMILEGPYATQSNRIIRMYSSYVDHFLRVDFRDEEQLQYRWERAVDATTFLQERVGGILNNGFVLAGRHFEFLAYSSSALRSHAVWFLNPFYHKEKGCQVDSEYIRKAIGAFEGTQLLRYPSKYAARLGQAFTATDPSVSIRRIEWEEVRDLGVEPYLFTDGVGTISKALGNRIWAALCAGRSDKGVHSVQPSAYQIRFLGYKGVVGVDEQLDQSSDKIHMRLRKSMRKFDVQETALEVADIEIAQAFEHPNTCYLNRPLIMVLEDLGVKTTTFLNLYQDVVARAYAMDDSTSEFQSVLESYGLGRQYRLSHLLRRLEGLNLNSGLRNPTSNHPFYSFLRQVRDVTRYDVLRDIKYSARISVPDSYFLVGVADEGPAYQEAGMDNVYVLPAEHIFACIQISPDSDPIWLEGACSISRSPVVHPGDVQRVRAIGKPPDGTLCLFAHMKNVVVLPSVGTRSLASQLGGGDVDGDQFSVIHYGPLLPSEFEPAASYKPEEPFTPFEDDAIVEDRDSVRHICNFVVEYINSDVLGLLSDRLLMIADQSKDGIRDKDCLFLAQLCSQAVDYPKQGNPVDMDRDRLPETQMRCQPDWHETEAVSSHSNKYYVSSRALGVLYRRIELKDPDLSFNESIVEQQTLSDPVSLSLKDLVGHYADINPRHRGMSGGRFMLDIFRRYVDELQYICATHIISKIPGDKRLSEAEVVVGTILDKCSQKRCRSERTYKMRLHASTLAHQVQREFVDDTRSASDQQLIVGLGKAWDAWVYSQCQGRAFGACSFGLIALGVVFECLEGLGKIAD